MRGSVDGCVADVLVDKVVEVEVDGCLLDHAVSWVAEAGVWKKQKKMAGSTKMMVHQSQKMMIQREMDKEGKVVLA